ncbi:MAG TPA: aromatic ring-hydroxylating dioxygenase subunit alpha [Spongiibacteraceae bacterium]|nr:aromatic ring-hydroxylating dioxygenase subunit alpha [Spongiibacteraceae bacterium]
MQRSAVIELNRRLIQHVLADTTDEAPGTMSAPASLFLERERWLRERELFFLATPQVIGFAGQVAQPGSYLTVEVLNTPIVVTRAEDGVLRAFINACAHRGARIADGCGVKKRLTCGFHGWSYALDGKLAGRPQDAAFDAADASCNLLELPVSDRAGLLVVGLRNNIDRQRVEHMLDDIAPAFAGFGFERMHTLETQRFEVAANWKLVVNLSHEGYHFATLHRTTLAPLMTGHSIFDEFGRHTRWAFPLRGIERLNDIDESEWPTLPLAVMSHTIFPGTVIVVSHNDAQMIRVEPGASPDTSVIYYSGVCADPARFEESRESYRFGGDIFGHEDLRAALECQQGLAAGRSTIIIGRNEPIVQFWHRSWNAALIDR